MAFRLGIDVGGTFTDLFLLNEADHQVHTHKVSSTPDDPSRAILTGVKALLERHDVKPHAVSYLAHGTTVATNTILQHAGARVAMVTTEGFRDLLEIGRQKRPSVYDLFADKPPVLVPRHLRREIGERIAFDGSIVRKLKLKAARTILRELLSSDIDALAICFLHAYANPVHERRIKELAQKINPKVYLSVSHELTSEFREYERFLTAVLNAYVGKRLQGYLAHLQASLREAGLKIDPHIIQSNGGLMSIKTAAEAPVRTVLSGPSAGVVGAAYVARVAGIPNIITLDMGGTSTDVSLLRDLQPNVALGQRVAGYPIRVPTIAIHTIGAGGGSIAWTDDALGFHVGPRSAGAAPGPAAYGLGGDQPTVTDANIFLGRLNQKTLLAGAMPIYRDLADQAIGKVARVLKLSKERTASGILQIVVSAMVRAVRVISVEKGEDPRDFTLLAFGGAGALHGTAVARQLGIKNVFIPTAPGLLCSMGALLAVPTMEYARTRVLGLDELESIVDTFAGLKAQAVQWLAHERVAREARQLRYSVDMRYVGQNHELTVHLPHPRFQLKKGENTKVARAHTAKKHLPHPISRKMLKEAVESFHAEHTKQFGYASPEHAVQIVSCRVVATGVATRLDTSPQPQRQGSPNPRERRQVYFESTGEWMDCPVYWRGDLFPAAVIPGPAIVEQLDATTVLYPEDAGRVDAYGNILITVADKPVEAQ